VRSSLAETGYAVAERMIDVRLANALYLMFHLRRHRGETRQDDQVPDAESFWGDSTLDALLIALLPDVERIAGQRLVPTYCYGRLYARGTVLPRHIDRSSAEVVANIHLGYRGNPPGPISFLAPGSTDVATVDLRPGDAVVFFGTKLEHWRGPFEGEDFAQVLLNYVRADGPNRDRAWDGRAAQFPQLVHDLAGPTARV
jgi:hypothetical protein